MKAKHLLVLCSLSYILNGTEIKRQSTLTIPNATIFNRHIQRYVKKMKKEQPQNNNIVHVYCSTSSKKQPQILSSVVFFD